MSGIVNQPALADLPRVTRRAGTEGFLSNLVEDLTPQLGGRLDPNGQAIGWDRGADLTSASPLVIGTDGNYFVVTGVTGFSVMTVAANSFFGLQFSGALTMTDGASLDLGGANITTVAGTRCLFFATATDTVKLVAVLYEGDQRRVDSTGAVTNAVQPAFRAYNSALTDVTGDGTTYTVVFANEAYDQNNDFDGTSTFTAPTAGRYLLTALISVSGFSGSVADNMTMELITSNDIYQNAHIATNIPESTHTLVISIVADMDASDTATVTLAVSGESSDLADIMAGAAHFSGVLLA